LSPRFRAQGPGSADRPKACRHSEPAVALCRQPAAGLRASKSRRRHDPKHDVLAALAKWVETGEPPETIIATRYKDDDPGKGVEAQRPWCVYPEVARFSGKGEHSDAANFSCAAPKE